MTEPCEGRWIAPWDNAISFRCDLDSGHDGPHVCTLEAEGQSPALLTWEW